MKLSPTLCLALSLAATAISPSLLAIPGQPDQSPKTAYAIRIVDDRRPSDIAGKAAANPHDDPWNIHGKLAENAMFISLQGLANTDAPRVYVDYPADWHFHDFSPVKQFYQSKYGMTFTQLDTPEAALHALKGFAKGYVVWDPKARTSLDVAFTAAGILRAVVVDEALIPLAEREGLKPLADFRGLFVGKTDMQIFQWAYDKYWKDCSRHYLIWMGGVGGDAMEPGVADIGIAFHAFVADLSADPKSPGLPRAEAEAEFAFHKRILAQMAPDTFIFGWHSYPKDQEGQWITLTSGYGLKVIGLNTLPNTTFTSQIGFSPGFRFTNSNHVTRQQTLVAEKKVYVALEQSDSMGIGAWTEPERGQIPYNWEVGIDGMRWYPAEMEMFVQDRTPNDYFLGGQSGYMYPVAIPPDKFPALMQEMNEGIARADEHVVGIMDHTRRGIPLGYFDLPKSVVDEYYKYAPDVIGFVNGYASSHTFDLRNGQAFMSYDYYLDQHRAEDDVVADLNELMQLNPVRPYFLFIHVRESNSLKRVMSIMKRLNEHPTIEPLDTFLKLAASNKTYETFYRTEHAPDPISEPGSVDGSSPATKH